METGWCLQRQFSYSFIISYYLITVSPNPLQEQLASQDCVCCSLVLFFNYSSTLFPKGVGYVLPGTSWHRPASPWNKWPGISSWWNSSTLSQGLCDRAGRTVTKQTLRISVFCLKCPSLYMNIPNCRVRCFDTLQKSACFFDPTR